MSIDCTRTIYVHPKVFSFNASVEISDLIVTRIEKFIRTPWRGFTRFHQTSILDYQFFLSHTQ